MTTKDKLLNIRNNLFNKMPVGEINTVSLLKIIKNHLNELDNLIDDLDNTTHIIDINCPEWLDSATCAQAKSIWESHKTIDDHLRVKAVEFIRNHAKEHGYEIRISKATELIKQYCL